MKFRRSQHRDNLRVNLTPLIDTVFLLLIFFMMTTTFNRQSQLNIDLPQSKGEAVEEQVIRILIDAQGDYALNDWEHSLRNNQLATLKQALTKQAGGQENPPLLISADKDAPHHAVMTVMEAARDLGYVRLSFEAQQRPD